MLLKINRDDHRDMGVHELNERNYTFYISSQNFGGSVRSPLMNGDSENNVATKSEF